MEKVAQRNRGRQATRPVFEMPTFDEPLVHLHVNPAVPHEVPTRALGQAMIAWMTLVFGLCYVALPMAAAAMGLHASLWTSVLFNLPAFVLATLVFAVGALVARPQVKTDVRARRDPVIAASLGGLLSWGVIHNLSALLVPFADMGAAELATFVGINVVEMGMTGMMLASFTRSPVKAFGLGAAFQLLVLGILMGLAAL